MALIKSALELALERTENVASDKEGLRLKELTEKGKKIASVYLNEHQDPEKFRGELEESSKEDRKSIREGAFHVLKANFILPVYKDYESSLETLEKGFSVLAGKSKELPPIFKQISQFFLQYIADKEKLVEALKSQMAPMARSKSQQLAAQSGMKVDLSPEELPEFARALRDNMGRLNEQYQQAMEEIKKELDERVKP